MYDALLLPNPAAREALKTAAETLGELLEQAGNRSGEVPVELWREIAEAAVRVAAAAQMLAGDVEEDGSG